MILSQGHVKAMTQIFYQTSYKDTKKGHIFETEVAQILRVDVILRK